MAKNDNRDKSKQRLGTTPNTPGQQPDDEWKDDEVEAELKTAEAANKAQAKAQLETTKEAESYKEGFFGKAVGAVKHALHLDEPKHLSHATPRNEDPEHIERLKEAHRVELGEDGAAIKGLPINKVPGRLRKFVSNN